MTEISFAVSSWNNGRHLDSGAGDSSHNSTSPSN